MMDENKLIERLRNLRGLAPSAYFAAKSKGLILSTRRPERSTAWSIRNIRLSIKESFGFAVSVSLVAVLIALLWGYIPGAFGPTVTKSSSLANSINLVNDANAAVNDINVHLSEINTFNAAAQQSGVALSDLSPASIRNEENSMGVPNEGSSDNSAQIDSILNQLITGN